MSPAGAFRLAADEVHCWSVGLDVPPGTCARLEATLADDERDRSARLRFERDRRRFIVAHGALRELLGRYLQMPPGRVRYVRNPCGKPDLDPGLGGRLKFNLSHSAGLALIAVTAGSEVGVDLEWIRAQSDYAEIARCFFSTVEADQLSTVPDDRYAAAFVGCWTKKEAVLKAYGRGLTVPLNSFAVPLTTDPAPGPADLDVGWHDVVQGARWSIHTLRPAPGYVGALAIESGDWRLSQRPWPACAA
jgi:4'-phosphopantetheinyl transferase